MHEDWFLPTRASTMAGEVDALYIFMVALTGLVSFGIAGFIVFSVIRFHKKHAGNRMDASMDKLSRELAWNAVPLLVSSAIFLWSAKVCLGMFTPPNHGQGINVVGLQGLWKVQHPQGAREINALHVPVGRPVRLVMTSEEVSCGTRHSGMIGEVVVMESADYRAWLATGGFTADAESPEDGGPPETLAGRGARLYQGLRCTGCHSPGAPIRAPDLAGLFGSPVPLEGAGPWWPVTRSQVVPVYLHPFLAAGLDLVAAEGGILRLRQVRSQQGRQEDSQ